MDLRIRKGRPFMLLRAYFGDSGSDGQSPYYVLAGYLSLVEKWEAFADRWQAVLDQNPKLRYFKTKESFRLQDEFRGWSAQDRDEKVKALRAVIDEYAMTGFAIVMPQDLYDKFINGKIPPVMDSPYFFCFLGLIELTSKAIQSIGLATPVIDFVFDEQGIEERARPIFDGFKAWNWPAASLVGHLDWRSDTKELPLQAADFLACGISWQRNR